MQMRTNHKKEESKQLVCRDISNSKSDVEKFKRRMLEWPNPVEFVNNMYGCHPDDDNTEYFKKVFSE